MLKSVMKEIVYSLGFYDWIGIVGYSTKAFAFKEQLSKKPVVDWAFHLKNNNKFEIFFTIFLCVWAALLSVFRIERLLLFLRRIACSGITL